MTSPHRSVDTKIQEIANSTTMQTVSSSLAVALAEFEASQSRSSQLRLDHELGNVECKTSLKETTITPEIPPPRHTPFTTKRLRDAVSYQIGGHCFRADDESSATTPDEKEVDEHAKDQSLTRLQFVVTSVFGLREAARNRSTSFECFASRLFMTSVGPNILGGKLLIFLLLSDERVAHRFVAWLTSVSINNRRSQRIRTRYIGLFLLLQSRQSLHPSCGFIDFFIKIWKRESHGFGDDINISGRCK